MERAFIFFRDVSHASLYVASLDLFRDVGVMSADVEASRIGEIQTTGEPKVGVDVRLSGCVSLESDAIGLDWMSRLYFLKNFFFGEIGRLGVGEENGFVGESELSILTWSSWHPTLAEYIILPILCVSAWVLNCFI